MIVEGCCSSILSVKFLLWMVYVPGYSVDYFHKNSECIISRYSIAWFSYYNVTDWIVVL